MRKKHTSGEVEYNNKEYYYEATPIRDDSDAIEGDVGYNMNDEIEVVELEIYDEKDNMIFNDDVEVDSILGVTDEDIIKILKKIV